MDTSIGAMLDSLVAATVRRTQATVLGGAGAAGTAAESPFAKEYAAQLERVGGETVDATWQRAQLQQAARNGPGDAMMEALSFAADERHRTRGQRDDLFFGF